MNEVESDLEPLHVMFSSAGESVLCTYWFVADEKRNKKEIEETAADTISNDQSSQFSVMSEESSNVNETPDSSPRKRFDSQNISQNTSNSSNNLSGHLKSKHMGLYPDSSHLDEYQGGVYQKPFSADNSSQNRDSNYEPARISPPSSTNCFYGVIVMLTSLMLIICGVAIPLCSRSSPISSPTSSSIITLFINHVDDLTNSFENQSTALWRILRAGTRRIIEDDEPVQPAVFIIVVPFDAVKTANCLVREFSAMITKLFGAQEPVEFSPKQDDISMPEKIKRQIDEELSRGLSSGSRVAIVHHLEQIPSESAMMFHSFCDNDNAPYRRVVFIMTLYVDELSSSIAETDDFVERRLEALWGEELGSNRYQPLFSRIGGSNAFIRPESRNVLRIKKCWRKHPDCISHCSNRLWYIYGRHFRFDTE